MIPNGTMLSTNEKTPTNIYRWLYMDRIAKWNITTVTHFNL